MHNYSQELYGYPTTNCQGNEKRGDQLGSMHAVTINNNNIHMNLGPYYQGVSPSYIYKQAAYPYPYPNPYSYPNAPPPNLSLMCPWNLSPMLPISGIPQSLPLPQVLPMPSMYPYQVLTNAPLLNPIQFNLTTTQNTFNDPIMCQNLTISQKRMQMEGNIYPNSSSLMEISPISAPLKLIKLKDQNAKEITQIKEEQKSKEINNGEGLRPSTPLEAKGDKMKFGMLLNKIKKEMHEGPPPRIGEQFQAVLPRGLQYKHSNIMKECRIMGKEIFNPCKIQPQKCNI